MYIYKWMNCVIMKYGMFSKIIFVGRKYTYGQAYFGKNEHRYIRSEGL